MEQHYPFTRVQVDYDYSEFMPYLDPDTVYLHYHNIYKDDVDTLNYLIASYPKLQSWSLEELITQKIPYVPVTIEQRIKYFAGSLYNHGLFFDGLNPKAEGGPVGKLLQAIADRYGSYENFENLFLDAVKNVMGTGFVWLNSEHNGDVHIAITRDYQTVALKAVNPIFLVDVWEHSYYLRYPTQRDKYVEAWFHFLDWEKAEQRYLAGRKAKV